MVDQQPRHESPAPSDGERRRPRRRSGAAHGLVAAAREAVIVVAAALVLSLLVKTFLVQAFYIPSPSMENTLLVGDRVLVSQLTPGPFDLQRGDVVVFEDPGDWLQPAVEESRGPVGDALVTVLTFVGVLPQNSGQHLIKRVIGLPGDHVVCCDAEGLTTVNGTAIHEGFLKPGSISSEMAFDVTVPADSLWVEGDNRQDSGDSRYNQGKGGGFVPVDDVVGRAVVTVWPLNRITWLSRHGEAFSGVPDPSASSGG